MSGFSMSKVAGVLTAANGNPVAGALVTATLSEAVHNAGVSYSGSFNTKTSATGRFEISVPSNTDEGTFPAGSFYTFSCLAASLVSEVIVPPSSVSDVRLGPKTALLKSNAPLYGSSLVSSRLSPVAMRGCI